MTLVDADVAIAPLAGPGDLPPASRALSHLKTKLSLGPAARASDQKIRKLLKKALEAFKSDDYAQCCRLTLEALDIDRHHPQANHVMAVGLERMGELAKSIQFYERALELDPGDNEIYFNLGLVAWRLKMLDAAERLFRLYITREPNKGEGYNNLGGVLRDKGHYDDAMEILRSAIYQIPEDPQLWNSLGTVMMEAGNIKDARTFYEEAIRHKPDFARAYHNLGYLLSHTGPYDEALEAYDRALELPMPPHDRVESEHGRAICLFHLGRLSEGFAQWQVRTEPRYRGAPLYGFRLPEWNGEPLAGRTLFLVAEQGLGDEIMFAHAVPELIEEVGENGRVLIACDRRLVPLFQRSFPKATVGPYSDQRHNGRGLRTAPWLAAQGRIDYFSPLGSTLRFRRGDIASFSGRPALLVPDGERVRYWCSRLAELGPGPYVGVCWKSLAMTAKRQKFYTPIQQWGPVLNVPGTTFVNLQYGECASDIAEAAARGATIHNFEDLDIRNNLDDNAALCAALDLVVTAPNAASAIAGATGTEVWFITIGNVWPQLGTDHMPWYPKTRVFEPATYGDFSDGLARAGAALAAWTAKRAAA